jgi:hypothetical protein
MISKLLHFLDVFNIHFDRLTSAECNLKAPWPAFLEIAN